MSFPIPRRFLISLLGLILGAGMATSVGAKELSAREAVEKVRAETQAKVLSVQTLRAGKRKIYRIKILTPNGRVRVVEVDANQ